MGQAKFRFFIGKNGSGKSAAMEALGLVLTRIVQDESPGFGFRIIYDVRHLEKVHRIYVSNLDEGIYFNNKFIVKIDEIVLQDFFSNRIEYHPGKIIAQASGPTSILEDVLIDSPIDSLKSDIYDVRRGTNSALSFETRLNEIKRAAQKLNDLTENPKYFFIDSMTAKFVLITLCAIIPKHNQEEFIRLRKALFSVLGNFTPHSFALVVDEEKYKDIKSWTIPRKSFVQLVKTEEEERFPELEPLNDFVNISTWGMEDGINKNHRTAVFHIQHADSDFKCERLSAERDPLTLLSTLLIAKREGLLKDAHLAFRTQPDSLLLSEKSLSDGEYLWLARLGLALLFRYEENSLFLFDEPDIHLNESWIVNFIQDLHKMTSFDDKPSMNEFIIATHSTLILTDAAPGQLYHFENDENGLAHIVSDGFSTFASNRSDIANRVFGFDGSVGAYSKKVVKRAIRAGDREQLRKLSQQVGPGFMQFMILDKLADLGPGQEDKAVDDPEDQ